jgi:hypothetical protein
MRAIPIKIGTAFEKEIYKMILKFIWKWKAPEEPKEILSPHSFPWECKMVQALMGTLENTGISSKY